MSTKATLLAGIGILIISSVIYFSAPKKAKDISLVSPVGTPRDEALTTSRETLSTMPKNSASSEEIIDYLVDGLSEEETRLTQTVLDTSELPANENVVISTNF